MRTIGSSRKSGGVLLWHVILVTAFVILSSVVSADQHDDIPAPVNALETGNMAVVQLLAKGAIGPATAEYLVQGIAAAATTRAQLIVILMDTPGGLDSSMRQIIQSILQSPVPVATYVSPQGARAASAGTYILYASHIAAMAPATNLGAATPVQIGITPELPQSPEQQSEEESNTTENMTPMEAKAMNDAAAYIRGLAELRGRNVAWAEKAVRDADSLAAGEALELQVIDLIAEDVDDLLRQLDGRTVNLQGGIVTLELENVPVELLEPNWRHRFLAVIADPNIAYILMLVGVYGLFLEFYNPGGIIPGVAGAICLITALYAFQVLPISYTGLALIALGIILMVMEAFVASTGILGIGGVIAFAFGSVMLMDTQSDSFRIAKPVIAAVTSFSALILILLIGMLAKARKRELVGGNAELLQQRAEAMEDFDEQGLVRIHGELWQAKTTSPVKKGQRLAVKSIDDLTLILSNENDTEGEQS